jgi:aminoglycoside 3-N-acetyltransferase
MHTISSLINDLERIGVSTGMNLIVHSSLKAIGPIYGGAASVIIALESVLKEEGTLAMPTHTCGLTDPSGWISPPAPESDWEIIRKEMPAFEPDLTPTERMGFIPETFRKQNGVIRSNHPHVSWGARGKFAELITSNHALEKSSGEYSPLARLYDLNAWILLLGVDHRVNTSIHLAESRSITGQKKIRKTAAPILINGQRQWIEFQDIDLDDSDFEEIGKDFEKNFSVQRGKIGDASSMLLRQREIVDFALEWMNGTERRIAEDIPL